MENNNQELGMLIGNFEKDENVKAFRKRRSHKTAFELLERSKYENAYSNFLAWLLDKEENSETSEWLGKALLLEACYNTAYDKEVNNPHKSIIRKLLEGFRSNNITFTTETVVDRETYAYTDNGGGRMDLFVRYKLKYTQTSEAQLPTKINVVLENKVFSKVGGNQLETYYDYITKTFTDEDTVNLFVLLAPEELAYNKKLFVFFSYQRLVNEMLEPMLEKVTCMPDHTRILIEDFISVLATYRSDREHKIIALNSIDMGLLVLICSAHKPLIERLLAMQEAREEIDSDYEESLEALREMLYMAAEINAPDFGQKAKEIADKLGNVTEGKVLYEIADDPKHTKYSMTDIAIEVIRRYIEANPNLTYNKLQVICRRDHNPGCNNELISDKTKDGSGRTRHKRIKRGLCLKDQDGKSHSICVSTQWTRHKTQQFLTFVKEYLNDKIQIKRIH